jgi:HK97 family phage prohead protease
MKYDFKGLATKYGVKCRDGRTILPGTFKHQDNTRVPILWQHQHNALDNVLGHGQLSDHEDGMRIQAKFNDTLAGQNAKKLVAHGDVGFLSIWANDIVENGGQVSHGNIREVSIVVAAGNPGASIDSVMVHSDDPFSEEQMLSDVVIIHSGSKIEVVVDDVVSINTEEFLEHSGDPSVAEVLSTMDEAQQELVGLLVAKTLGLGKVDDEEITKGDEESLDLQSVWDGLDENQKVAIYILVEELTDKDAVIKQSDTENNMTQNIFEGDKEVVGGVISHADQANILGAVIGENASSLKRALVVHAGTYGIDNIGLLFPDSQDVKGGAPHLHSEDMVWVEKTLNKTRKTPFARIKSSYADISGDDARAKGYITGAEKMEEVFPIFSRETFPQTIYKKQKLDRDDIIDVTSFDMIAWLKIEMQMKLKEELAQAILIGDMRAGGDPDKIKVANIRPIYGDDVIYSHPVEFAANATILDIIDGIMAARNNYKGSGNPAFYCTTEILTAMMIVRNVNDDRIHKTEMELMAALRVSAIIEVPPMDSATRLDGADTVKLLGIIVNLRDYVIGADKGGKTTFFEGFDIDFNQNKYLYETRVSGALVLPKAALIIEQNIGVV